jgi:hypothetical protein
MKSTKKKAAEAAAAAAAAVAADNQSSDEEPETLEAVIGLIKSMAVQFTTFSAKIDKMESKLTTALDENKKLHKELTEKVKIIQDLQTSYSGLEQKINNLEQYNRAWSVRITNLPVTSDEEKDPIAMRDKVYQLAFRPILDGALNVGDISSIPSAAELLEIAHVLPSKPGTHKPIIARFRDRVFKTLCLRLKKNFATKTVGPTTSLSSRGNVGGGATGGRGGGGRADESGTGGTGAGWIAFPFHEDLTALNYRKMKAIGADPRVQSCWSINGQLRFKLVNSQEVRRVVSIFDPLDTILA